MLSAICIIGYRSTGLSVDWSLPAPIPMIIVSLVVWIITYPRTQTDSALAVALLLSGGMIVVATQYPALALGRPLVDEALLKADRALGVGVPAIMTWMQMHPRVSTLAFYAYETYIPQQFIVVWMLACRRDRRGIWTFLGQQHLCLAIALALCTFLPASEPYAHLGLQSPHPQTRSVEQITAYNSGASTVVGVQSTDGLVSFPSCHAAGAVFFIWALRRIRVVRHVVAAVNALLLIAAVGHGVHYFVDLLAGVALGVALIAFTERLADRTPKFGALGPATLADRAAAV
jgi:membrane-associated phospholipid phosphatase